MTQVTLVKLGALSLPSAIQQRLSDQRRNIVLIKSVHSDVEGRPQIIAESDDYLFTYDCETATTPSRRTPTWQKLQHLTNFNRCRGVALSAAPATAQNLNTSQQTCMALTTWTVHYTDTKPCCHCIGFDSSSVLYHTLDSQRKRNLCTVGTVRLTLNAIEEINMCFLFFHLFYLFW